MHWNLQILDIFCTNTRLNVLLNSWSAGFDIWLHHSRTSLFIYKPQLGCFVLCCIVLKLHVFVLKLLWHPHYPPIQMWALPYRLLHRDLYAECYFVILFLHLTCTGHMANIKHALSSWWTREEHISEHGESDAFGHLGAPSVSDKHLFTSRLRNIMATDSLKLTLWRAATKHIKSSIHTLGLLIWYTGSLCKSRSLRTQLGLISFVQIDRQLPQTNTEVLKTAVPQMATWGKLQNWDSVH